MPRNAITLKPTPWIALVLLLAGCGGTSQSPPALTLATTTSTRDSGLLDVLVPNFEKETGIVVKVVAAGSGQALELGRRGDADVLLTHAPEAEAQFMTDGFGDERHPVMHNDFVLVGPATDPAKVAEVGSITAALQAIAATGSPFVSRGDESGTHLKERHLWQQTEIEPTSPWHIEAGTGMAAALRMASERRAYTLSDRGTFLAQQDALDLKILREGDPSLHNPYTVIVVGVEKHPDIQHDAAQRFAEFLTSPAAQAIIGKFGVEKYGQPLFFVRAD